MNRILEMEPRLFQVHTEALLQEWQQIVAAEKYDFEVCVPSKESWFEVVPCSYSRGDCAGDSCPTCQGWLELQLDGESGWVPRWLVFGHEFNDGSSTSTHDTSSSSLSRPPPALPSRPPVALHDHEVVELAGYGDLYYELPATELLNCPPGGGGGTGGMKLAIHWLVGGRGNSSK